MRLGGTPLKFGGVGMRLGGTPLKFGGVGMRLGGTPLKFGGVGMRLRGTPLKIEGAPFKPMRAPVCRRGPRIACTLPIKKETRVNFDDFGMQLRSTRKALEQKRTLVRFTRPGVRDGGKSKASQVWHISGRRWRV